MLGLFCDITAWKLANDGLISERDAILEESRTILEDKSRIEKDAKGAQTQLEWALNDNQRLISEKAAVVTQLAAAVAERDVIIKMRDSLAREEEEVKDELAKDSSMIEGAAEIAAEVAERSKHLAHDLNNALTVIIGSASVAKADVIPEGRMYSKLALIDEASASARNITAELLALSSGKSFSEPSEPAGQIVRGKGRVLLMDEDEHILQSIGDTLHYLGYDVDTARDGDEAVSICTDAVKKGTAFRVVILDADITVGTSIGATSQKLRSIDPSVKLIISSGYIPGPDLTDPKAHGFDAALPKPYSAERLSRTVSSLMS